MTLRERLHEFFHVAPRETWQCERHPERRCPLEGTVDRLAKEVEDWLREKAGEPWSDSGSTWFDFLATEVAEGRA